MINPLNRRINLHLPTKKATSEECVVRSMPFRQWMVQFQWHIIGQAAWWVLAYECQDDPWWSLMASFREWNHYSKWLFKNVLWVKSQEHPSESRSSNHPNMLFSPYQYVFLDLKCWVAFGKMIPHPHGVCRAFYAWIQAALFICAVGVPPKWAVDKFHSAGIPVTWT